MGRPHHPPDPRSPIPDRVPGLRLLAEQTGLVAPEELDDLAPIVDQAAPDTGRPPQIRTRQAGRHPHG
ncbi:hypothetical protein [Streptomyces sp. NPDC002491]